MICISDHVTENNEQWLHLGHMHETIVMMLTRQRLIEWWLYSTSTQQGHKERVISQVNYLLCLLSALDLLTVNMLSN
jgi:hypothetical protein